MALANECTTIEDVRLELSHSEVMGGPTKPSREISVIQSHQAAFLEMIGHLSSGEE